MKSTRGLAFVLALFLVSCQPTPSHSVTILDNGQVIRIQTEERVPAALLHQAGITLDPQDTLLINGFPAALNQPITTYPITLQIRHAVTLTLAAPDGERQIRSSAFTLGEMLADASVWLHAGDEIDAALDSALPGASTVHYFSSRPITIIAGRTQLRIQSSAKSVGEALAETGIPLLGLDYSLPAENAPLPANGQIKVVRVTESLVLAQKPIPFDSDLQASAQVPLDQTQILQPGEAGLSIQRIRIRFEDGNEISRLTEKETLVRPPRTRILGYGTKVEVKTAVVDGVKIEYWRAVQMYATSYSPCRSGTDHCSNGTASGKSLRKGMVGLRQSWYLAMGGQPLYVPGYGYATVEDVCGGCVGKPWIDLGFSDSDYQAWHSWVTVYFLTPVPPNIIYVLE